MQDEAKEVLMYLESGRKANQYCDSVRAFALTLHFYSPRAYRYVRLKFNKHLPDPSCLRSWISNCTGYGEPGICNDSLKPLKMLAKKMKTDGKILYCSLAFDEMSIRKHVQWSEAKKKFLGFINFGSKNQDGEIPVAKQALVFMITGVNIQLSLPVAHFFIDSLSGTEKACLIKEVLKALTNTGVKVINITFDGFSNNFTALTLLGASFKLDNMKPYIISPFDGTKIHVSLDTCHMLKLIRNCLGSEKKIRNGNNEIIEWKFFETLEKYRVERNLVLHKVTKKHIQWYKNKMNVKLAAQLFSKSVSDSLNFLSTFHEFKNCEATAEFALKINDLFDIFNSKESDSPTTFKNMLTKNSSKEIFTFLDQTAEYLKSLQLKKKNILQSQKKTGFKGFLINIMNLKSLYNLYVETDLIDGIPTFQISQDLLESFFGRIRSLNGCSDNPTVTQFTSAFRKLLIHNEITSSDFANCEDNLSIFSVSSRRKTHQKENDDLPTPDDEVFEAMEEIPINENNFLMDCCEELTISSIASSIEKKIQLSGRFECECVNVLKLNEKVSGLTVGETIAPCLSTLYACKIANTCFNQCRNQLTFNYDALLIRVLECLDFENIFTDYFMCDESHKIGFIKYIVEEFIRLQATYIAKNITLVEQKVMCRNFLKKKIHFLGQ